MLSIKRIYARCDFSYAKVIFNCTKDCLACHPSSAWFCLVDSIPCFVVVIQTAQKGIQLLEGIGAMQHRDDIRNPGANFRDDFSLAHDDWLGYTTVDIQR